MKSNPPKDPVFPTDIIERYIRQQTEKESVEQFNLGNLVLNSIFTLIWAQRMHKLLWEGEPQFNEQNNTEYKLLLEFEYEFQRVFNQQYEYLKNYAVSLKNKDVSMKCLTYLNTINPLYK